METPATAGIYVGVCIHMYMCVCGHALGAPIGASRSGQPPNRGARKSIHACVHTSVPPEQDYNDVFNVKTVAIGPYIDKNMTGAAVWGGEL